MRVHTHECKSYAKLCFFLWEDKEEGFTISSFCVVLAIKNTLFFDCEKACL